MSEHTTAQRASDVQPRWSPTPPGFAILPGILLAFVGAWMVSDGGSLPLGWACLAVGGALLIAGTVAAGVAWGLDLHLARRR